MATELEGGCFCGAVRYRVTGSPRIVVHCHCTMCRRAQGAAMVTWLIVNQQDFALLKGEPAWYRSSDHGRRGFCGTCGTPLLFTTSERPAVVDITAGSLDRPEAVTPERHVHAVNRVAWLAMNDGLPRHSEGGRSPLLGES